MSRFSRLNHRRHNTVERKKFAEAIIFLSVVIGFAIAWGWPGGVAGCVLGGVIVHFIDHSDSALK